MTTEYDKDPLLYNRMRDAKLRELNKEKYQYYRSIGQPSLPSLSEDERNTLNRVLKKYDREYNVYKRDFDNPEMIDKLEGLGFVRVETNTGRIIPSFVFQEHGKPIFQKRQKIVVDKKEFKL